MSNTPLLDRISELEYHTDAGHRVSTPPSECALCIRDRRKPAWLRRMDENGLPAKDYTLGSYVPKGSGDAA